MLKFLVGNKVDLEDKREVTKGEAEDFAANHELTYFETSAKENINLKEGFEHIIDSAYKRSGGVVGVKLNKQNKAKQNKCC